MIDKIIEFIEIYCDNVKDSVKKAGKCKTISEGLNILIRNRILTSDELRKELSLHIKRIVSEKEFAELLNSNKVENATLFSR